MCLSTGTYFSPQNYRNQPANTPAIVAPSGLAAVVLPWPGGSPQCGERSYPQVPFPLASVRFWGRWIQTA